MFFRHVPDSWKKFASDEFPTKVVIEKAATQFERKVPVPSRETRDGTAATKPSRHLEGGFCGAARFSGGQPSVKSSSFMIRPHILFDRHKWPAQNETSGYSGQGGVKMAPIGRPFQKVGQVSAGNRRTKMSSEPNVIAPKRGDRVAMAQQEGVYEVADINSLMQTANLKTTDGQGHITRNVPWTALKPLARK
jgi:hypothetical protein